MRRRMVIKASYGVMGHLWMCELGSERGYLNLRCRSIAHRTAALQF
ncbi:MAG: hypothetical protein ACXV2A_04065 [Halobacteriota archaeon]